MPNIILKDGQGVERTYSNKSSISVKNDQGGTTTFYLPEGKVSITDTQEVNVAQYGTAQVVDENLVPENIAAGVTVLGIAGTHAGGGTKPEETFDVTPTKQDQQITPTSGSVFSGGIVRRYVPNLHPKSVTPTDSLQFISYDAPYDGLNLVVIQPIPTATHMNRQEFCEHYGRPGAVIVSPDGSGITVYETVKEGSSFPLLDLGWEEMPNFFGTEDADHAQVAGYMDNAAALLSDPDSALRARFDAIFADADRVDFCGYACDPIAMPEEGDEPYTWNQLVYALLTSSKSLSGGFVGIIPMQWFFAEGEEPRPFEDLYAHPFVAKFPFIWKAMKAIPGAYRQVIAGYTLQEPSGTMPVFPGGAAIYPGQPGSIMENIIFAAVNGVSAYGVDDFVVMFPSDLSQIVWYSATAQTIPEAFLNAMMQQQGGAWVFGSVTLDSGFNVTTEIYPQENTTVSASKNDINGILFRQSLKGITDDCFSFAEMDDFSRSMFKPCDGFKAKFPEGTMPTFPDGTMIYPCVNPDGFIAAVNGVPAFGTDNFILLPLPLDYTNTLIQLLWYSETEQTLPQAFLNMLFEPIIGGWAFGDVELSAGFNFTSVDLSSDPPGAQTSPATPTALNSIFGQNGLPAADLFDLDTIDDYTKSVFDRIDGQVYEETGRFSLELYLTCYGETDVSETQRSHLQNSAGIKEDNQ